LTSDVPGTIHRSSIGISGVENAGRGQNPSRDPHEIFADLEVSSHARDMGKFSAYLQAPLLDLVLLFISQFLPPLDNGCTSLRWSDGGDLDHPAYQLPAPHQGTEKVATRQFGLETT
jgi:hypothetical protein